MVDLSVIYSKTPRGLRARASLVGGLSSHLMKVLSLVDGTSKAEAILLKFDHLTPEKLLSELAELEKDGFIKVSGNTRPSQEWSPTIHFTPMVVEEYQSEEELEAIARTKADQDAKLAADRKANAEEALQREIKRKAQEEKALIQAKSKAKVEAKLKAEQEEKRLAEIKAREEAELAKVKAEEEAKERALQEAERIAKEAEALRLKTELADKLKAEEAAKAEQEEKRLAELKALEEAELAKVKAEEEAKERALQEAERIAKEVEEFRIKTESETKKKEEEARAALLEIELKEKAELQAKINEKENAHFEIERVLREAEEKRKKAAKKAKEEKQEAKRKAKAAEDSLKAQVKSKDEIGLLGTTLLVEDKTKLEEEFNRITIEKIVLEDEEERLSRTEKLRQKQEDQAIIEEALIKTKLDEEEREKTKAKEKSLAEMERISKEADAIRKPATILKFVKPKKDKKEFTSTKVPNTETMALAKMEERARKEAERIAKEEQELAEIEAEEIAQKNTKEFAKTVVKPIKKINIEETKHTNQQKQAKVEKEFKPYRKVASSFKFPTKTLKAWAFKIYKIVLVYIPLTIIILVGIAHFINLHILIKPFENLISENVKDTVTIQEVRLSLLPEPHIVLGNVSIGKNNGYKIESIYIVPTRASLFGNEKIVKSAVIEGMQVNQANFTHIVQVVKNLSNAEHLKVEDLHLKNITINIRDVDVGVFDGKLKLSESSKLQGIDLISTDNTLNVTILSSDTVNNLMLNAHNWVLPIGPKVLFTRLTARGVANQDGINFSNISGELYGGSLNAKLVADWSTRWQFAGSIDLAGVNASQMLTAVNSPGLVEGKLKLSGNFSSKTSQFSKIVDEANISADFVINNGSIKNVELARAVISNGNQSLMGDDTHFDKMTGSLHVENGVYQYRKIVLQSPQFRASGYFDIIPNQLLSGKVSANLLAQSRRLQSNFTLEGTSNNPRSK